MYANSFFHAVHFHGNCILSHMCSKVFNILNLYIGVSSTFRLILIYFLVSLLFCILEGPNHSVVWDQDDVKLLKICTHPSDIFINFYIIHVDKNHID